MSCNAEGGCRCQFTQQVLLADKDKRIGAFSGPQPTTLAGMGTTFSTDIMGTYIVHHDGIGWVCTDCTHRISVHPASVEPVVSVTAVATPPRGYLVWHDVNPYEGEQSSTHTLAPFSMIAVLIAHYKARYGDNTRHCWVLKTLFPWCRVGHSVGAHIIPRRARKESYLKALQHGFVSSWTEEMINSPRNGIVLAKFLEMPFDNLEWCFVPSTKTKGWKIVIFCEPGTAVPIVDRDGDTITVGQFECTNKKGPLTLTFGDLTRTNYDLGDVSVSALAVHAFFAFKKHGNIEAFPLSAFQERAKDDSPIKKWRRDVLTGVAKGESESDPTCHQCTKPCGRLYRDVFGGNTMICVDCWALRGECKICNVRFESTANAAELHLIGKAHEKQVRKERPTI